MTRIRFSFFFFSFSKMKETNRLTPHHGNNHFHYTNKARTFPSFTFFITTSLLFISKAYGKSKPKAKQGKKHTNPNTKHKAKVSQKKEK